MSHNLAIVEIRRVVSLLEFVLWDSLTLGVFGGASSTVTTPPVFPDLVLLVFFVRTGCEDLTLASSDVSNDSGAAGSSVSSRSLKRSSTGSLMGWLPAALALVHNIPLQKMP